MMRALEETMHQYYLAMCKPASKKHLGNWGEYIAALRKAAGLDSGPATIKDAKAIDHVKLTVPMLQQIKDQDRNLIMHPEIVLTSDESSSLFRDSQSGHHIDGRLDCRCQRRCHSVYHSGGLVI